MGEYNPYPFFKRYLGTEAQKLLYFFDIRVRRIRLTGAFGDVDDVAPAKKLNEPVDRLRMARTHITYFSCNG